MSDAYRSDEAALRIQVDALREQLSEATDDANEHKRLSAELERALDALKKARLSEAEQTEAAQRVGRKRAARGVFTTLAALSVLGLSAAGTICIVEAPSVSADFAHSAFPTSSAAWFATARKHCNPVEANNYIKSRPPPDDDLTAGYVAACYALAHRIDDARRTLRATTGKTQGRAVKIVFDVVHPVADAGDDVAAGPVMELVLELWPNNYMAVFHAGMAAYDKEEDARARDHLERFMGMYRQDDIWRRRATQALDVLKRIADGEVVQRPDIPAH